MAAATISLKLDIIPGGQARTGKVFIPGQEPLSDSSSNILAANMHGKPATVDVADVLATIPGTYILWADNWTNNLGVRKSWLVFPPYDPDCCTAIPDYYQMLRDIDPREEPEHEEACNAIDTGFCPSPDWTRTPPPEPDPYQEEGESPYGVINYSAGTPPPWNNPNPQKKVPGQDIYNQ